MSNMFLNSLQIVFFHSFQGSKNFIITLRNPSLGAKIGSHSAAVANLTSGKQLDTSIKNKMTLVSYVTPKINLLCLILCYCYQVILSVITRVLTKTLIIFSSITVHV